MQQAEGDGKVTAMAEVIEILVRQRREIHEQRASLMREMMAHMGQHVQMADAPDGRQMMMYPMMRGAQSDDAQHEPQ